MRVTLAVAGPVPSVILIKQESVNRANGFLRELGRNEMRSPYLYSCCKGLARIGSLLCQVETMKRPRPLTVHFLV